jgi:hypothetical protein
MAWPSTPLRERFDAKWLPDDAGHWLWTGSRGKGGYGRIYVDGGVKLAHRVAWLLYVGDPGEALVLHRCGVKHCVNPGHLYLGDHGDNYADRLRLGEPLLVSRWGTVVMPRVGASES